MKRTKKVILDEDMAKVGKAFQTNTPLVIWENGRVVKKKLVKEKDR